MPPPPKVEVSLKVRLINSQCFDFLTDNKCTFDFFCFLWKTGEIEIYLSNHGLLSA